MEFDKFLPILISLAAFILALFAYWKSTAIANANLEISIYNLIRNSKSSLYEITKELILIEEDKGKKAENTKKLYESLVEDLVTAYEEACSKYLDGKVDKIRFKKSFKNDIERLVKDSEVNKIVNFHLPVAKSQYGAILKVYEQWFNKEG